MNKCIITFAFLILISGSTKATNSYFKGLIVDKENEPLIGSVVYIPKLQLYFVAGLNGIVLLDKIPEGKYEATVSCVGFEKKEILFDVPNSHSPLTIQLEEQVELLNSVSVVAQRINNTESSARTSEKMSHLTLNVMSSQAIELSTDLDVAGVVNRISGVSIERNGAGSGSYSLIRGMPKRYNSTLVNGLKMPSPDNKYRYVPLNIFPSGLVDRVEVYKSLSPSMESDAIGGVMNLIMKDAPQKQFFQFDFSMGYHSLFSTNDFLSFDRSNLSKKSPYEINGPVYNATQGDFTTTNLNATRKSFVPDFSGNLVLGNRFINKRLGVLLAVSSSKSHKGANQTRLLPEANRLGSGAPQINNMQERFYSSEAFQLGGNLKLDYILSPSHIIKWNNLFTILDSYQLREGTKTRIWGVDDPNNSNVKTFETRFRTDKQAIFNTSLSANYTINASHAFDWALAYSYAKKNLPDQGYFVRVLNNSKGPSTSLVAEDGDNERKWEYNSDHDVNLALNYEFKQQVNSARLLHKIGGLARLKNRNSFYIHYKMDPDPGVQAYGHDWEPTDKNIHFTTWEKYEDVTFRLNSPTGSTRNELNHDASEAYLAAYYELRLQLGKMDMVGGIRMEDVDMGYTLLAPRSGQKPTGHRHFFDILPSISAKYNISQKSNLKASFYTASTKPGFFEIIPYYMPDEDEPDYKMVGNSDLKKVLSYNYDLKFDYFPSALDKVSAGLFYKNIIDPIEGVLYADSTLARTEIVRGNLNMGSAQNYGMELEFIKYVRQVGLRVNYTYTNSSITTDKLSREREDPDDPASTLIPIYKSQERPLQGQAKHIGNVSLLYKNMSKGLDAQLSMVYTGERIKLVSGFYNMDEWEKAYTRLDLSIDKSIGKRLKAFARFKNILNTPYQVFIKYPVQSGQEMLPLQSKVGDNYIIREDNYGMSFRLGFKYKL